MRTQRAALIALALVLMAATTARPQEQRAPTHQPPAERRVLAPGTTTITEKTAGMERRDGFFPFYWDAKGGRIWLEIPAGRLGAEFLYVNSLPAGLGSNDIGLDRGQLGADRIVKFERSGPKILLIQPNYDYRAITDN
ncbi:MAG: DUF5118 domain-containing protein, partial [Candidatus Acidiferrales bacterium]